MTKKCLRRASRARNIVRRNSLIKDFGQIFLDAFELIAKVCKFLLPFVLVVAVIQLLRSCAGAVSRLVSE